MTNEEIKNKLLSKSCEAELINQDGSKGQVLQVIPIGYIYSCFDEIEKLLTQTKKACYGEMMENIEKWCLDYMADANHNLEYNKPTPPIWEYLKDKLK